jgi:hypothetical protein
MNFLASVRDYELLKSTAPRSRALYFGVQGSNSDEWETV